MCDKTKAAWTINGLLALILVLLAGYYINNCAPSAYAAGWDTDGIMVATAVDAERVVLVDTKAKNIMIYRINGSAFRLVGARSYEYDVEIVTDTANSPIEKSNGATWLQMKTLYEGVKK